MAVSYQHLKQRPFAPVRQRYTERDTMLYGLSLGLGNDPLDAATLPFVFEGAAGGLRTLPSQAVVLGYPGFWAREADTRIELLADDLTIEPIRQEGKKLFASDAPGLGVTLDEGKVNRMRMDRE